MRVNKVEFILIIFSFLAIFSFATLDNAISPLVREFHQIYSVPMARVLQLISSCTFGIVLGTFIGPLLISHYQIKKLLIIYSILLVVSILGFIFTENFFCALILRFVFGFFVGLFASVLWWITYHGVKTKKALDHMLVVMMTARPIALSLGVPAVAYIAIFTTVGVPFILFSLTLFIAGITLSYSIVQEKLFSKREFRKLIFEYIDIFRIPYSGWYYISIFLSSLGYFGFYSFGGIWFISHYNCNTKTISTMFFVIGLSEVIATFLSPKVINSFEYKKVVISIFALTAVFYAIFIGGFLPIHLAIPFIILFIVANKIHDFIVVRSLPIIFNLHENKATLGSLITLSAWFGFAVISGLQSTLLPKLGIIVVGYIMLLLLTASIWIAWIIQKKVVIRSFNNGNLE